MEITYNNIKSAINRLKPYKLYGRKEQIENIREKENPTLLGLNKLNKSF